MKPSFAFIAISWAALLAGFITYIVILNNSALSLEAKDFFFTVLLFGLYSAISLQKAVRDRLEGVPVTAIYYGLSWIAVIAAVLLMVIGLLNLNLLPSEKGLYAMAFILSTFGAVAVQKNTRDNNPTTFGKRPENG